MMLDDKLIVLFGYYAGEVAFPHPQFTRAYFKIVQEKLPDTAYRRHYLEKQDDAVRHAAWMAKKAIGFVKEAWALDIERRDIAERFAKSGTVMSSGNDGGMRRLVDQARSAREKAHRWLGFIQGVLWMSGVFTLDELKEHSRRCSDELEKEETKTRE